MTPVEVVVKDKMQRGYSYLRTEPEGEHFDPRFRPHLTPKQMLELGVFGGKYMTDCRDEFPAEWFTKAKLSPEKHDKSLNFFKVDASQPLSVWIAKHWVNKDDPRGWFQWYCRYYLGRRIEDYDVWQIKRWRGIARHVAQLQRACPIGELNCRPVQRQALLHWAYDSRKL
jgi:hypothetical protein